MGDRRPRTSLGAPALNLASRISLSLIEHFSSGVVKDVCKCRGVWTAAKVDLLFSFVNFVFLIQIMERYPGLNLCRVYPKGCVRAGKYPTLKENTLLCIVI